MCVFPVFEWFPCFESWGEVQQLDESLCQEYYDDLLPHLIEECHRYLREGDLDETAFLEIHHYLSQGGDPTMLQPYQDYYNSVKMEMTSRVVERLTISSDRKYTRYHHILSLLKNVALSTLYRDLKVGPCHAYIPSAIPLPDKYHDLPLDTLRDELLHLSICDCDPTTCRYDTHYTLLLQPSPDKEEETPVSPAVNTHENKA